MESVYGIIGHPLAHSFSPAYFHKKFIQKGIDASYHLYELKNISDFPKLIFDNNFICGLNVTIPYKQQIIPYLNELSDEAKKIGAVNCIHINKGFLKGYNTDVIGFEKSLNPLLTKYHGKALILGTGGSSLAVKYVLEKLGIGFLQVSRNESDQTITYSSLNKIIIQGHKLIINTTPLGMFPEVNNFPDIPYEHLGNEHLLYDVIYNPAETKFLALGKTYGAQIKNGFEMLQLQAEASWEIWNQPTV